MMTFSAATTLGARCRGHIDGCYRLHQSIQSSFVTQVGTTMLNRRTNSSSSKFEQDDERKWTLLYHRNTSRSTYPRALFGLSTFNFSYWTWYVADFTPSLNASAAHEEIALGQIDPATLEMMLIDPNMGYVGLGIGSMIWLGAFFYAKQLVSAIWAPKHTTDEERTLSI